MWKFKRTRRVQVVNLVEKSQSILDEKRRSRRAGVSEAGEAGSLRSTTLMRRRRTFRPRRSIAAER
jgi:hypothetical protein